MKISIIVTLNVFLILNFIVLDVLCQTKPSEVGELVFTSILYRHGERTPLHFYKNDPYKNISFWPEGIGMLTNKGKIQQYELGKWLRMRYKSLIPKGGYSSDLIYIQSTDVDRTLMSAMANLAGMFPPTEKEVWNKKLKWQPIPVHTSPVNQDKLIATQFLQDKCPKLKEEKKKLQNSETIKRYNEEHAELYQYVSKHTGDPINLQQFCDLYNELLIESLTIKNFKLPDWARSVFPDKLEAVCGFSFSTDTMTKTLKRLTGGPHLKDIIIHMKQKSTGTLRPNRNMWVYSAHDTTVAALLGTMGVYEQHSPPFVATVMVELRKNDKNNFFVSVHYKNSTGEPHLLTIPGCKPYCPLNNFESLLSDVIPQDWDSECRQV